MPARLSASGYSRAKACPASFALPAVEEDSAGARAGRARHLFLSAIASGQSVDHAHQLAQQELRLLTPSELKVAKKELSGIKPEHVPLGETEVAMAINVHTGVARRLQAVNRQYDVNDGEIAGTADLIQDHLSHVLVMDWKGEFVAHDNHRDQLSLYALMAARVYKRDAAQCRVIGISESGELYVSDHWSLDWEDLAIVASDLRETWQSVQAKRSERAQHEQINAAPWTPDVAMGEHCRWCSAATYCPARQAQIKTLLGLSPEKPINANEMGLAFLAAQTAETLADHVRKTVKIHVLNNGPVPTPDGRAVKVDSGGSLRVGKAA